MNLFSSTRIVALAAAAQLLLGCALLGSNPTTDPTREQQADPNSSYALLYSLVSVQKSSDKILITGRQVTGVMGNEEKNPQRKMFWMNAQRRFDQIYDKLVALLETQYYSK